MGRITLSQLKNGCAAFRKEEPRDAMYRVASRLLNEDWGKHAEVADGLGVVLLTWNQAAYRYGHFDFGKLEQFLRKNAACLNTLRRRHIKSFGVSNEKETVEDLFNALLDALAYTEARWKTPVGVAKALHLLAPDFFPIWDRKIAAGCGCNWSNNARSAAKYIQFMEYAKDAIASLEAQFPDGRETAGLPAAPDLSASLSQWCGYEKTMLKFLDEYHYAKYTLPHQKRGKVKAA